MHLRIHQSKENVTLPVLGDKSGNIATLIEKLIPILMIDEFNLLPS
jgi:hypothetical protein